VALIDGCSESPEHRASRTLLEEVTRASKLYDRALGYLGNPVYRIGEQYAPVRTRGKVDESAIVVPSGGEIHPEVLPTLSRAQKLLGRALNDNKDAAPTDQAIARTTLARILSLTGYYHAISAERAIGRTEEARQQVRVILSLIDEQSNLLECGEKLSALGDQEVQRLLDEAANAQSQAMSEIKKIEDRVAELEVEKAGQGEMYEKLNAEARALGIEGRLVPGQEGLTKLEDALELQKKANAAESKAAEIEIEVDSLDMKRKALELTLNAATIRIEAMTRTLEERKALGAGLEAGLQRIKEQLNAHRKALAGPLAEMVRSTRALADAQMQASNVRELAVKQLTKAAGLPGSQMNTDAQQADVLVYAANLEARCLEVLERNKQLVLELKKIWATMSPSDAPINPADLESFLSDPAAIRQKAEARYTDAVKLYEKVIRRVERQLRWAYQGKLVATYMGLYKLTRNPETLTEADRILKEALSDKKSSPHLASVVRLRQLLPPAPE
jgi:hypothetical protein